MTAVKILPTRAIGYVRVSTEVQAADGISLEAPPRVTNERPFPRRPSCHRPARPRPLEVECRNRGCVGDNG
jgi:hypothetical protein